MSTVVLKKHSINHCHHPSNDYLLSFNRAAKGNTWNHLREIMRSSFLSLLLIRVGPDFIHALQPEPHTKIVWMQNRHKNTAAAAAKSLQSCPTLCNPIAGSLRPWDSPGKNTGVGCHFLPQCMKVKSESEVVQLCPTPSDPMDCSLPGSSVHGIFQARVLEWKNTDIFY